MNKALKLLLTMTMIVVPVSSMADFSSKFVDLDEDQQVIFRRIIDNVYEPFLNRNTVDEEFKVKLLTIQNTLVHYINTNYTSDTVLFSLEYLIYRIQQTQKALPQVSNPALVTTNTTVVTQTGAPAVQTTPQPVITQPQTPTNNDITPAPSVSVNTNTTTSASPTTTIDGEKNKSSIDTSKYYDADKNILAGTTSDAVFKYEIIAKLEGAVIEQLAFAANTQDFEKSIDRVSIYDEEGNWIADERPNDNKVVFNAIDREIPVGQTDLFVTIESKAIGYNSSAPESTSFSLDLDIQESRGVISGNDLTVQTFGNSETITIVPTIISHVLLTENRESRQIDTRLNSGEKDLAIIVLGNRSGTNTNSQTGRSLQTVVERIVIEVEDNTTIGNAAYNLSISAIDGSNSVEGNFQNGSEVSFDLSELGNDAIINDQEEIAFIISGDIPTLDPETQESLSIKIKSTDDGGIFIKTTDATSLSITDLNLRNKPTNRITHID